MEKDNEIKDELLVWLKNPYTEPMYSFKKKLESYNGADETVMGAGHFINDGNSYSELHSITNGLQLRNKKSNYKWLAAAVVVMIIGIGSILTLNFKQNQYEKFLVIEEGLPVFMGEQANAKDEFMNAYRTGNYEEALKLGELLPKSDTVYFYMGCSHLYTKQFQSSIQEFKNIMPNSRFYCNSIYQHLYASVILNENSQFKLLEDELLRMGCSEMISKASLLIKKASD